MFGERATAANVRGEAEVFERVAEERVVLIAAPAEDGDVAKAAVRILSEPVERGAECFADFGGFAGSGEERGAESGERRAWSGMCEFVVERLEPSEERFCEFVAGGEKDGSGGKSLDEIALRGVEVVEAVEKNR